MTETALTTVTSVLGLFCVNCSACRIAMHATGYEDDDEEYEEDEH